MALDKETGEVLWFSTPGQAPADMNAQSVPIVAVIAGQRLIIDGGADGTVYALRARTGEKLWEFHLSKRAINSSPVVDGDTVYIGATDSEGRSVSILQSVYFDWGSGVVVGDTGILWQNRGAAFSLDPKSPNVLKPGKRPFYTLSPGIALKDDKPHILYGTQGADGQPQTLAVVLTRLLDYKLDPLQALARPRFLLGRTFSDSRDSLKLERNAGADVFAELARRGHEISPIESNSPLGGQAGAIVIHADGKIEGAHDPRSDGSAMGV